MSFWDVIILAVVQGFTELLPISSSAHVIVVEKLLRLDPSSPSMTLLLVMLHSGTMLAVLVYFWKQWQSMYFQSWVTFRNSAGLVIAATVLTGVIAEAAIQAFERIAFSGVPHAQIEDLFSHLELIAPALGVAGVLILIAGVMETRRPIARSVQPGDLNLKQDGIIGAVQGLCVPFRGFSRSGATISAGMLAGAAKARAEAFSFALAVVLTPFAVAREVMRLVEAERIGGTATLASTAFPSLAGVVVAFLSGLLALRWLSRWLEGGRWYIFGVYCLVAAVAVSYLHHAGY